MTGADGAVSMSHEHEVLLAACNHQWIIISAGIYIATVSVVAVISAIMRWARARHI